MKYKVLKDFYKLSEQKNYFVDDTIELSKEDAQPLLNDEFVSELKTSKPTKDND